MRKIFFSLFLFFGFCLSGFSYDPIEVFDTHFLGDDDRVFFYIQEMDLGFLAFFADTKKAEVNYIFCDRSEADELKKIAFEAKVLIKSVDYRYSYDKEDIYNKIVNKISFFAPNLNEKYDETEDLGFVKLNLYMTDTVIKNNENLSEQTDDIEIKETDNQPIEKKQSKKLSKTNSSKNALLSVWSFTDEIQTMIEYYYKKDFPDKEFDYRLIPTDSFSSKLDTTFKNKSTEPDIFTLEDSFVRNYVEKGGDYLLDLTDIYNEIRDKTITYAAKVGSYKGKVYALSWLACPGAMFYRRSLAKKYLGTDDPSFIQKRVSTWDDFLSTAETLKRNSNGKCVIVASMGDLFIPYKYSRKHPWVVNGKLEFDPVMKDYMDMCKTLKNRNFEGRQTQWADGWFDGMKGELKNEKGMEVEVFSYFLPTWGLHYVLKANAPETSGDWAMIQGPSAYYWGGTWLAINKKAENPEEAKKMLKYIVSNDVFLENWAKDTGDLTTSIAATDKIKDTFNEPFLGGQNQYTLFEEIAKKINGDLRQSSDDLIEALFGECVAAYVNDEKSKVEAIEEFRKEVKRQLGF